MSNEQKRLSHRRPSRWEMVDEINIRVVPRFKTSGLSGDEWRQHVQVDFLFKGVVIGEAGFRDMDSAMIGVGGAYQRIGDEGIPDSIIALSQRKCDQPSCKNDAVARFRLKRLTADDGSWLDPSESEYSDYYRKFCAVHLRRGDCSREDCDDNYEQLDGIGPEQSTNTQESPSAFGGVMVMSPDGEERQ